MFMPAWSPALGRRESPSRHLVHPLQKAGGSQRPAAQAGRRDLPHLGGRHRLSEEVPPGRLAIEGRVAKRPEQRVVGEQRIGALPQVVARAGPAVSGRIDSDSRTYRVQLDVAHARQQPAVGLDQAGAEAAFPQRAAALVALVEPPHVIAPQRLHHAAQPLGHRGRGQQVHVIVHQYIGVQRDLRRHRRLAQEAEVALAIRVVAKQRGAVVAALEQVVRVAGDGQP